MPAKNTAELIAYAKASPGKYNYASVGPGSAVHLALELFKLASKVNLVHVPYKGGGPALGALVSGEVQVSATSMVPTIPHAKAGRVRMLAITISKRSPVLPDIPTVAEAVPGYEVIHWYGIWGPKGMPRDIVSRWNKEVAKVLQTEAAAILALVDRLDERFALLVAQYQFLPAFLVNPFGKHWSQLTASDLLLVDHDGRVLEGEFRDVSAGDPDFAETLHRVEAMNLDRQADLALEGGHRGGARFGVRLGGAEPHLEEGAAVHLHRQARAAVDRARHVLHVIVGELRPLDFEDDPVEAGMVSGADAHERGHGLRRDAVGGRRRHEQRGEQE